MTEMLLPQTEFALQRARAWRAWYRRWCALAWAMVAASCVVFGIVAGISLVAWVWRVPYPSGLWGTAVGGFVLLGCGLYQHHLVRARYLTGREHPDVLLARAQRVHLDHLRKKKETP